MNSTACAVFTLPKKAMAWIPWGFLCTAVYYNGAPANDKEAPKWAHFLSVTVLAKGLAQQISKQVFAAVNKDLDDHYKTESAQ
eukprot:8477265-Pyramimonas_sp.AAC.1